MLNKVCCRGDASNSGNKQTPWLQRQARCSCNLASALVTWTIFPLLFTFVSFPYPDYKITSQGLHAFKDTGKQCACSSFSLPWSAFSWAWRRRVAMRTWDSAFQCCATRSDWVNSNVCLVDETWGLHTKYNQNESNHHTASSGPLVLLSSNH